MTAFIKAFKAFVRYINKALGNTLEETNISDYPPIHAVGGELKLGSSTLQQAKARHPSRQTK